MFKQGVLPYMDITVHSGYYYNNLVNKWSRSNTYVTKKPEGSVHLDESKI